jgi:hypothetical protein
MVTSDIRFDLRPADATDVETLHGSGVARPKVPLPGDPFEVALGDSDGTGYHRDGIEWTLEGRQGTVSKPFGEITHEVKSNPWRFGIIYADRADHRLIVRQRSGLGWTLNFGRPLAWVILAAFIGISLARRGRRHGEG